MATPRKRWFRVADSIGVEPWSNDVLATCVRLQAYLNTRWARDGKTLADSARVVLRPADLMALTGSGSLVRARRIVRELATHVSLVVDAQGVNTVLEWRKFAEFQRYESEPGVGSVNDDESAPPPPRPASRVPRTKTEREGAAAPPAALSGDSVAEDPELQTIAPAGYGPEAAAAWRERLIPQARDAVLARGKPRDLAAAVRGQLRRYARAEREKPRTASPQPLAAGPTPEAIHEADRLVGALGGDAGELARAIEGIRRESGWAIQQVAELHAALLEGEGFFDLRQRLARGAGYRDVFREAVSRRGKALALEQKQMPLMPTPYEAARARRGL